VAGLAEAAPVVSARAGQAGKWHGLKPLSASWLEILEIADDSSRDYVKKTGVDDKVTWVFDKEHFAHQWLKIKALKWMLARMAPRKYGNG
jgi:hypothetical protein